MAVGPIRGLLAAHFQLAWNRHTKELGRRGRVVLVLVLVLLFGLIGAPMLAGLVGAGYALGGQLADPVDGSFFLIILGGLLGALAVVGGFVGGLLGGSKQLAWEQFRGFPLSTRQLFSAELIAGLGDILSLVVTLGVACLLLGLAVARPATLPLLPWVLILTVALHLCVQLIAGSLAARLVKRLHFFLGGLMILVWGASMLAGTLVRNQALAATAKDLAFVQQAGRTGLTFLAALPTTWALRGVDAGLHGQWLRALGLQLYPLALLLGCMSLGAWLLNREREATTTQSDGSEARLWSFRSPALGLARLQWLTLLGSHLGKFGFAMPVMTVVLIKGPFAHFVGRGPWTLPGAFLYLALLGNQFHFNQFGLDRHGVKTLFLLPIPLRVLMRGKVLGLAAYQGAQVLVLTVLMAALFRPEPQDLLASLLLMGCVFLFMITVGQVFSALYPRAMSRTSLQSGQMPLPSVLGSLGGSLFGALFFGGPFVLLKLFAPAWLVPGMAALVGLVWLGHRLCQPLVEELWDKRREAIVEAMG
jgi:hypothetical protein